jgi:hypothetical protein
VKLLEIPFTDGDFALVRPCPRGYLDVLEVLLKKAHGQWLKASSNPAKGYETLSESCLVTLSKVLKLLPRADSLDDLEITRIRETDLVRLFIAKADNNGQFATCDLINFHQYEPCKSSKKIPKLEDEMTVDNIPIPSSGSADADILGALVSICQGDAMSVQLIYETWDAELIDKVLFAYNERQRDPEERLAEYRQAEFDRIKEANKAKFRKVQFGF